jgi:hypothetical protein
MKPHPTQHLRISCHAIDRYRQRVADVLPDEARRELAELAADATRRPTPRRWTPVEPTPGVLFLYPHRNSDLCLLVRGATVITVFSRVVAMRWRKNEPTPSPAGRRQRMEPYHRPSPGTWPLEAA